jgi:hypothetical protein
MDSRLTVLPGPRSFQEDRDLLLASFKVIEPIAPDAGLPRPKNSRQEEWREISRLFEKAGRKIQRAVRMPLFESGSFELERNSNKRGRKCKRNPRADAREKNDQSLRK